MDPLSISVAITDFAALAGQICLTLKNYVDGVQSAPAEVQSLLQEVQVFFQILGDFGEFLRIDDLQGQIFEDSSVLIKAVEACVYQLKELHGKLADISDASSSTMNSTELVASMKWPLTKDELQGTVVGLQRLANIFRFWMTMKNHELMSGEFLNVQSLLDENSQEMENLAAVMESLSVSIPADLEQRMADIPIIKTLLSELAQFNVREVNRLQDNEIQKIMPWLSSLQPLKRHHDIQQKRIEGTGDWFLQQPEFEKWRDGKLTSDGDFNPVLVCYGMPGAGKSVICSLVFDHLNKKFKFSTEENVCVVCLYCHYRDQKDQTPVNMVGVLLKQVIARLDRSGSLPPDTISTLREHFNEQKNIDLQEACRLLMETVKQIQKFYVCIDALDECNVHHRIQLVQSLEKISSEYSLQTSLRIFFTARPHIGLKDIMKYNPRLGPVEYLCLRAQSDDIRKYISYIIKKDDNGDCMTDELRRQILDRIVDNSDGMFLLPVLQIQTVLDQATISKRRTALFSMPTKLETAFESTIERIRNQKSERSHQGLEVLKWIFLAQRPLTVMELRHALSVSIDQSEIQTEKLPLAYDQTLDWDNFPSEKSLIDWCLGLVIVDTETSTIRLVHKSLHDHLTSLYEEGKIFPDGHSEIAYTCSQYMLFHDDEDGIDATAQEATKDIEDRRRARFCLLDYAANNIGYHLSHAVSHTSDIIRALFPDTLDLRRISTGLRSTFLYPFHEPSKRNTCSEHEYTSTMQIHLRLQFAISCGLENVFTDLLNVLPQRFDFNTKLGSSTMLLQASRVGQENIVRILLNRGVDINSKDGKGKTALSWACKKGHDSIVKLLLQANCIDINATDCYNRTALLFAAGKGHDSVVKLLLETEGISINSKDENGMTALSSASKYCQESVVKFLLQTKGIDINSKDENGMTALSFASLYGHESVVKILVQAEGIDINSKDNNGQTALSWACENGRESVVKLLLQVAGIDINSKNSYGRTALSRASYRGHDSIAKLLISAGAISESEPPIPETPV